MDTGTIGGLEPQGNIVSSTSASQAAQQAEDLKANSVANPVILEIGKQTDTPSSTPIKNPSLISTISSIFVEFAAACAKVINIARSFFFQQAGGIDQRFLNNSMKDFKGITLGGDYTLPKGNNSPDSTGFAKTSAGAYATKSAGGITTVKGLFSESTQLKKVDDIGMPHDLANAMNRCELNICGKTNLDATGDINVRTNAEKKNFYNDIIEELKRSGLNQHGIDAVCKLLQPGFVADFSDYFSAYRDANNNYAIESISLGTNVSCKEIEGKPVLCIENTTKYQDGVRGDDNTHQAEGYVTAKRTVTIPISELNNITIIENPDRKGEYNFSNIPQSITAIDEWSTYNSI